MKGISTDDALSFDQNDYPHQPRQNNIFKEWYRTSILQNKWYVDGVCEQKRLFVVYKEVKIGFGIHLV